MNVLTKDIDRETNRAVWETYDRPPILLLSSNVLIPSSDNGQKPVAECAFTATAGPNEPSHY